METILLNAPPLTSPQVFSAFAGLVHTVSQWKESSFAHLLQNLNFARVLILVEQAGRRLDLLQGNISRARTIFNANVDFTRVYQYTT